MEPRNAWSAHGSGRLQERRRRRRRLLGAKDAVTERLGVSCLGPVRGSTMRCAGVPCVVFSQPSWLNTFETSPMAQGASPMRTELCARSPALWARSVGRWGLTARSAATPRIADQRTSAVERGSAVRSCPQPMAAVTSATRSFQGAAGPGRGFTGAGSRGLKEEHAEKGRFGQREVQVRREARPGHPQPTSWLRSAPTPGRA